MSDTPNQNTRSEEIKSTDMNTANKKKSPAMCRRRSSTSIDWKGNFYLFIYLLYLCLRFYRLSVCAILIFQMYLDSVSISFSQSLLHCVVPFSFF